MKICVHDNRGNGNPLFNALDHAGHDLVKWEQGTGDILLSDSDDEKVEPYRHLCSIHEHVYLHPHGAGFVTPCPRHPHTRGQFVTSHGQAELLDRMGYTGRHAVIGWHFCELHPFRQYDSDRNLRVLFAPQHMMADGEYEPWLPALNRRLHDWLVELPVHLTVRYVHGWYGLGIERHPRVLYMEGNGMLDDALRSIEQADLVIGGCWTFPTLAVARGVPTIMYGSGEIDKRYADYLRFPLNADAVTSKAGLQAMISWALASDHAKAWRERFVGEPFKAFTFVRQFDAAMATW